MQSSHVDDGIEPSDAVIGWFDGSIGWFGAMCGLGILIGGAARSYVLARKRIHNLIENFEPTANSVEPGGVSTSVRCRSDAMVYDIASRRTEGRPVRQRQQGPGPGRCRSGIQVWPTRRLPGPIRNLTD